MDDSPSGSDPPSDRSESEGDEEYDETPSFYNNDEVFEKYLGQTSYYLALQNNLLDIVSWLDPDAITELGSGTGQTTIRLGERFDSVAVTGIDNRENVVESSKENATAEGVDNVSFETADMIDLADSVETLDDVVVMLYSFHHIPDPLDRKVAFLRDCFETFDEGSYLCIGETFLEDGALDDDGTQGVERQWEFRGREAYASTFWSALDGLSEDDLDHAHDAGKYSRHHEVEAGENVYGRDNEYLVSMGWLESTATEVGFDVVLSEPVNALGDGIVLLRR